MIYLLFAVLLFAGGYFTLRCFLIKHALKEACRELQEIQKDLSQNQILHLAAPDQDLEHLLCATNRMLEDLRRERQNYEKREKQFQHQIEQISHDLRTPLTVILGYLKFLKQADGSDAAEILEIIERKTYAMEHLVSQFYDFSRLSSHDCQITLQQVDAGRILREALLDHYQILERSQMVLEHTLPTHPVMALGDPWALERIFANLFQNAGRYGTGFLKISLEEQPGNICIQFTNGAESLRPEDVPHLFERFYMQDFARTKSGTGLGLAIAKSLAESMKGSLTASCIPDASGVSFPAFCDEKTSDKLTLTFTLTLMTI